MMSTGIQKKACVSDIAEIMEEIAPAFLAETWDNCGLQVGASQWPVDKIWVALDPLLEVI
jgi:putative NIF3 family GTP cyclohydrolase 1 type 2